MKQDHEAVRQLAIQIGVREAARRLNLNENTVRSWSKRFAWFESPTLPPTHNDSKAATSATKPGDVLLAELAEHEAETRISLARSARRMAKDAEELPIKHAKLAHTVAQTMAIVHRQGENSGSVQFSLNVLNLNMFDDKSD